MPDKTAAVGEIKLSDPAYPLLLREIPDPPGKLYYMGDPTLLSRPQLAVVGTRNMTSYGAKMTRKLVRALVEHNLVITSGLAYGIDTIAHTTALSSNGATIAVLGCGVDICYPREHLKVYQQIAKRGVIVSEIPLGQTSQKWMFVARNRIISGLSLGVLVIEGALRSGTLITASAAARQGREVFALPGPVTSRYSAGPHMLIQQGAKLVQGVEDILIELPTSRV